MDDAPGWWAVTGCTAACAVGAPGEELARAGRAKLRADLTASTTPSVTGGCDCARCCPPPLTDIEAQQALRHVSNHDVVAFALGQVALGGYCWCEGCDSWVPRFTEA